MSAIEATVTTSLESSDVVAVTGGTPVAAAAAAVRDVLDKLSLDATAVAAVLRSRGIEGVETALAYTFGDPTSVPIRPEMARLIRTVEETLGIGVDFELIGPLRKAARISRTALTTALFGMCVWLVLGGILTRENTLAHDFSPLFALTVLATSMTVLALLEAAHIAAVALSTADVSLLRESHPKVFALHKFIATKRRLERYLAGRQAGVVLVVFGIAEVTRTAGMTTLPGTSVGLPRGLDVFLQVGVPGAIMVLIVGQVAPQLIAARAPATTMNSGPMAGAFMGTVYLSCLGLASPANGLVSWFAEDDRIPSAPAERFTAETVDVEGFGIQAVQHVVHVRAGRSSTTTTSSTTFFRDGISQLSTPMATVATSPIATTAVARLLRGSETVPVVVTDSDVRASATLGGYVFSETQAPRLGVFKDEDVVQTTFEATYTEMLTFERILVSSPTRLVVLRAVLDHPGAPLPQARLTVTGAAVTTTEIKPVMRETDHAVEFTVVLHYPTVGSVIELDWSSVDPMPAGRR